jgi:hypothetical protein
MAVKMGYYLFRTSRTWTGPRIAARRGYIRPVSGHAGVQHVSTDQSNPGDPEGRVLPFRSRADGSSTVPQQRASPAVESASESPVAGLGKYERGGDDEDYRHRMLMNVLAFGFVVLLILAGVWIADKIALMRKNQDCVLSGRRGCTPVEVQPRERF